MIHPLAGLVAPRRVAVLGELGGAVDWQQQAGGLAPEILFVNPRSTAPHTVASLQYAPWQPDLAIILENPRQALVECSYASVPAVVVCSDANEPLSAPAAVRVLHVSSGHFALPQHNIYLQPSAPVPGKVALLSNRELVADALFSVLLQQEIGLSFYSSVAPSSDVQLDDLLSLLQQDEQSEIVGLYMDEPARPRMVLDVLSRVAPDKPIVALLPAGQYSSIWGRLLQHAGVTTVRSLQDFGRAIAAFTSPRHSGAWHQSSTAIVTGQPDNWRYISALRHLSGINPAKDIVDLDCADSGPDSRNARHVHIGQQPQDSSPTKLTGVPAAVHTAWQHAIRPTHLLAELPKEILRQELAAIPSGRFVDLPYIQALLAQADIPLMDGLWLEADQPADLQIKDLGQPVDAWVVDGDGVSQVHRTISAEKLRKLQRHGDRVWAQSAPRAGVEVTVAAIRDPRFGPIVSCWPALQLSARRLDYALPLAHQKATILAKQLLPPQVAGQESLAAALMAFGHLFASVPEIQKLDATIHCQPDRSRVSNAQLEWAP